MVGFWGGGWFFDYVFLILLMLFNYLLGEGELFGWWVENLFGRYYRRKGIVGWWN